MKVIILAGGKGTRLPKSAKNIPKPLVKIAGKPILQHQVDILEKHGLNDIRLSLGYKANQIIEYLKKDNTQTLSVEYLIEPKPLGTGGAIKFASKDLKEDFMILNGDILTDINFSEFLKFHTRSSKRTGPRSPRGMSRKNSQLNTIAVWHCQDARPYGLIDLQENKVAKFNEKPEYLTEGYINAGFYILSSNIFKSIKKISFSIEKDIFPKLAKNGQLAAYIHKGFWTDVGTEKRLKEAKREFRKFKV